MRTLLLTLSLAGCATPLAQADTQAPETAVDAGMGIVPAGPVVLTGATVLWPSGAAIGDLHIRAGRIAEPAGDAVGVVTIDVTGRFIAPAFIDSHVHLAYLPEGEALAAGGIAGAVDMAAPESFLALAHGPLDVSASGPMVTAIGGYPTQSWGSAGYGLECADGAAAASAVTRLVGLGARLIKLPVTGEAGDAQLDDTALGLAVAEAHRLGVPVASHATGDDEASRAARAGVDVLAHTPTGALSETTIAAWGGKTVVTTLVAFGNGTTTRANLTSLRAAGARVLYGTDFGNARTAAINADELQGMVDSGMTGEAILAAGTSVPADFWGFDDLGSLDIGKSASLLVLDADPRLDPLTLARPVAVYIRGHQR